MSLRLVNWNVEWAKPSSPRGAEILRRVHGHVPEVVCLTETHDGLLSQQGAHDLLAARLRVHAQGRSAEGHALVEGTLGSGR